MYAAFSLCCLDLAWWLETSPLKQPVEPNSVCWSPFDKALGYFRCLGLGMRCRVHPRSYLSLELGAEVESCPGSFVIPRSVAAWTFKRAAASSVISWDVDALVGVVSVSTVSTDAVWELRWLALRCGTHLFEARL